jgi:hypothetical protein
MTPEDAKQRAAAIGLTAFSAEQIARLAELAANTDAHVAQLPRLPKHVAPATVFVVPARPPR